MFNTACCCVRFCCVYACAHACVQLNQALAGKFNAHVHVEYEWRLQHEDLDESDEDLDEKVALFSCFYLYKSINSNSYYANIRRCNGTFHLLKKHKPVTLC